MTNDTNKLSEAVFLAAELSASAVTIYLAYKVIVGPDASKLLRMRITRTIARFAKTQESMWGDIGRAADTRYWQLTNA